MRRRTTVRVALLAVAVLLLGLVAPVGASASASTARVRGGTTTLVTAPGLVKKLLGAQIVSFVTAPGTASLVGGSVLKARYPVSGGRVGLRPPSGTIAHRGGLFIVNTSNGKNITVDNFIVDITNKVLTAHLVGTKNRLGVFDLNLRRAVIKATKHVVTISRIGVSLQKGAAMALNAVLGTTAFTPGLRFGTASSLVRI